jgi:recombination protein RecR
MLNNQGPGTTPQIQRLIDEFNRLPGIGVKSAQRLAYYLIRMPVAQSEDLSDAILSVKKHIKYCSNCFNLTDQDPCNICQNSRRNEKLMCVVEQAMDVLAFEKAGFNGLYHVLHGAISPIDGIGPENLKIQNLIDRIKSNLFEEIILSTNPTTTGDATALYISRLIQDDPSINIRITIPARGLSVGGDLEYADQDTLRRALDGRRDL